MAKLTTLRDILSMSPSERKAAYRASGISEGTPRNIDKVTIDNNVFTDYTAFTFLMEKSYVKSPVRSSNGSIDNLDSYAWFLTPHLKMDFSLMSIDTYRTMMKLIQTKNEFTVTCYDVVNDKDVTHNMYFATEQMPKLWAIAKALNGDEWVELLGVQDYTIELIGTNTAINNLSVVYHFNPPSSSGLPDYTEGEKSVVKGAEVIIGSSSVIPNSAPSGYKFKQWNDKPDGSGTVYTDGYVVTINSDLVLYATWEVNTNHTLNYSYGLSTPMISDNKYVYSQTVVEGQSIGTLPTFDSSPTVTYGGDNDTKYTPYYNGAWYKTPTKSTNSVAIKNGDIYWTSQDSTIYLIYDTRSYTVNYYLEGTLNATSSIQYNVSVPLPQYVQSGKTFDGWYTDSDYTKKFSGLMPPFALNLYGRWK